MVTSETDCQAYKNTEITTARFSKFTLDVLFQELPVQTINAKKQSS
jgi:hypothetical protein